MKITGALAQSFKIVAHAIIAIYAWRNKCGTNDVTLFIRRNSVHVLIKGKCKEALSISQLNKLKQE